MSSSTGFCNCCAASVPLLTDVELNESVCTICRSYDVTRDTIRNAPSGKFNLHLLADAFSEAFEALGVRP
jgi:hypothetical protein